MDQHWHIITKSPQGTQKVGERLAASINDGPKIYCLYGELGSGKTTLVQGFARGLGYTGRLLSPTFIITRRYTLKNSFKFLYHIDLYRLVSPEERINIGIKEIFDNPASVVLIEWADRLGDMLPKNRVDIRCQAHTDGSHGIDVQYHFNS